MTRQPRPSRNNKKKSKVSTKRGKVSLTDQRKRSESSRHWLIRQLNDPYVAKAQSSGYRSRAAFKLLEIDAKFHVLKPGITLIDLGAAPGGWTQVATNKLKVGTPKGIALGSHLIAVDLTETTPINGVEMLKADFTSEKTVQTLLEMLPNGADVILSDMAPPSCGMPDVDHIRIMNLVESAFEFACQILKPKGTFIAKVLQGGTEATLLVRLKQSFAKVNHFKPPASRKDSAEMYVIAQGFKNSKRNQN